MKPSPVWVFALVATVTLLVGWPGLARADGNGLSFTLDHNHRPALAPRSYLYQGAIDGIDFPTGKFNNPADLFVDGHDNLYVVDQDNNRIVRITPDRRQAAVVGDNALNLSGPQGVFVAESGDVYIADTGNGRVVWLDPSGKVAKIFGKPDTPLLGPEIRFQPTKVVVDKKRLIDVIDGEGTAAGIIVIDGAGIFRGFFGERPIGFDLRRLVVQAVASPEQKRQLVKAQPSTHTNLFLDAAGYIYTASAFASADQLQKLNSIGVNVYPVGNYGVGLTPDNKETQSKITSVVADQTGIITAVESSSGVIYQFDQFGNTLTAFGGNGSQEGQFEYAAAVVEDRAGNLYALDSRRGIIQIFRPTQFIQLVHRASQLYFDGSYDEAGQLWQEVLRLDSKYELAHQGLGKVYLRRGQYQQAMAEFYRAYDKIGYSQAFGELRYHFLRENFGWVAIAFVVAVLLLTRAIGGVFRFATAPSPELGPGSVGQAKANVVYKNVRLHRREVRTP